MKREVAALSSWTEDSLRTAGKQREAGETRSDAAAARRSNVLNGLSREERTFLLEKLIGLNDKDAAIAAGFTLSMAENTKQKIWSRPAVRREFDRLAQALDIATKKLIIAKLESEQQRVPAPLGADRDAERRLEPVRSSAD